QEPLEATITLSAEQGFAQFLAIAEFKKGWIQAESGEQKTGNLRMHQNVENWQKIGSRLGLQHWLVLLAESYGKAGQVDEGLKILDQGLALVEENGGHSHEVKLYRLKGELTLQRENQKSKGKGQKAKIPNTQHPTPSTKSKRKPKHVFRKPSTSRNTNKPN